MKTSDFYYDLPEELIAQTPLLNRSESRLLVMDKLTGETKDDNFFNIINYLDKNDCLVINNTRVIPARIYGEKEETHAKIELLILKSLENDIYECLSRPTKRLKIGTRIHFKDDLLIAEVVKIMDEGIIHAKFIYEGILYNVLDKIGEVPLPPYIHKRLENRERYQTVYSKVNGSSAAPTAGLHFTKEILDKIKEMGIEIIEITLNIGLGTFRPVKEENIESHPMHSETYEISLDAASKLNKAKNDGKRIVAIGTTSVRTLEANYSKYNEFKATKEATNIFIYPGYEFKAVNALITNFHLPESTLIMLVSAFSKKEYVLSAYEHAVKEKYRFFSFGDCMFIK